LYNLNKIIAYIINILILFSVDLLNNLYYYLSILKYIIDKGLFYLSPNLSIKMPKYFVRYLTTKNYDHNNNYNNENNLKIHPSFYTILDDKSRGGVLLSKIIYNMHDQNKLNLPLFLTKKGIKASHDLINMINLLPENDSSSFKGDNLLYEFLNNRYNKLFRFNMHITQHSRHLL